MIKTCPLEEYYGNNVWIPKIYIVDCVKYLGQVQAIDRMIEEDIPCEDVLSQINAAKSALT